ncbi:MAG: hypothetical protein ABFS30_08715 [Pseudomonadota bacterium]
MSRGFSAKLGCAITGALMLLATSARAEGDELALPAPYDTWSPTDIAARAFGVLAGQREVWLNDARLWKVGGRQYLAVIAEAARPNVDGAFCDCARPTRLALIEERGGELHTVAAALVPDIRAGETLSLNSPLLDRRLIGDGVFRMTGTEQLLPVVREWDMGARPRAELSLYRQGDRRLSPVFSRLIFDDPTVGDPDLSGMRARMRVGELDPGGLAGYADIRFVERYFTRFDDEVIELDDLRIEVWVFGGDRYSLVQCELYGPMGFGACMQ